MLIFYFFVSTAAVLVFTWLLVLYVGFSSFNMIFVVPFLNSIAETKIYEQTAKKQLQ